MNSWSALGLILVLTLINGLFAMSELAILSARKTRLQQQANEGDHRAQLVLDLAGHPTRMLSTIQIVITLVGILIGAFGEATLGNHLQASLAQIPVLSPYAHVLSTLLVAIGSTYIALIFGELVPKQVGLSYPEPIAMLVAAPLSWLSRVMAPLIAILSWSAQAILTLMGIQPVREPQVSEEEIKLLLQQGTEAGTFAESEQDLVERVFRLDELRISALMTPRPDIVWLDLEDPPSKNQEEICNHSYSRFPVCQGDLDHVVGIVSTQDLLAQALRGEPFDLTQHLSPPLYVPENTHVLKVLELLRQSGSPMALVVDEYGVVQGLVTFKDILEAIIGEIPSTDDEDEPTAIQREDGSWLVDGLMGIEKFQELFNIPELPENRSYHTLAGLIIDHLGHIPRVAEHFEWAGLEFEIVDMDGNRVDKVLITCPQLSK
ncbi:MAG: hemolysin family protein [Gloeomargarita sp. SKYBB_i_bin120]|nr:hemolysin family protein [Gloeomargarita sp. SKYG98]MCS7291926.1 hemolysin family protein [Gloeomargarita sp. SKYB120]MDW8177486.1 hemolysin family protein [Gloeomargarita sp. SKYBB_i_bin120]